MKKVIRLTESDLHRIVNNSVKKVLKEGEFSIMPDKLRNSSLSKQMSSRDPEAFQIVSEVEDLKDKIQDLMDNHYSGNSMHQYRCELAIKELNSVIGHLQGLFSGSY